MAQDIPPREAQLAAEYQADVGVEHIADVYAEAFLGATEKAGQTAALLVEFDSLIADVLNRFPELERVLTSSLVSQDDKVGILDRVLGSQASPLLLNFLKVLSRHGRLDCLRPIHRQFHELYNRLLGRVRIRLTTPVPVNDALAASIAQELRELLGTEPQVDRVVDPKLIGGAVIQIGDTVYDGSIAMQLKRMRQQIIDRSAHEIQSRRDRFRHPAGS
jgi:F-type H+-transporting ATPase subunit delta